MVPRGGIEPPTRGFSVLGVPYPPISRHVCHLLNYLIYGILPFPTQPNMMATCPAYWYHCGTTRMRIVGNVHLSDRAVSGTSCTFGISSQAGTAWRPLLFSICPFEDLMPLLQLVRSS